MKSTQKQKGALSNLGYILCHVALGLLKRGAVVFWTGKPTLSGIAALVDLIFRRTLVLAIG
jgi:hypothetical protein